jgi:hypothetical protein
MLKRKIKCTRFENIYRCSTHNNNNDKVKAIKMVKKHKVKLRFGQIWY